MGVTCIFLLVPASFSLLSLCGSWCLRFWDKKFILLPSVKVAVFVREKVLAHTPLANAWSVFLWTSTLFFYVNATGAPFRQPLGYFLFIDTCNSFASPWIQMSSSCKIMFFWWCEKQTNHARTSPPLFYIFHFFSCGVDLLVTVSLVLSLSLFFFLPFFCIKNYLVYAHLIVFVLREIAPG